MGEVPVYQVREAVEGANEGVDALEEAKTEARVAGKKVRPPFLSTRSFNQIQFYSRFIKVFMVHGNTYVFYRVNLVKLKINKIENLN